MRTTKKAISLIVLVITIIVLAILAATVIITITNSGLINSAKDSVKQYDLKQVQEMADLAWQDAYIAKAKNPDVDLYQEVIDALAESNVDTSIYDIVVSNSGATVTLKGPTIILDKTEIADVVKSGTTKTMGLTATTINVEEGFAWTTSNSEVATVTGNGTLATVTLKSPGNAIITVTAGGATATCNVTVLETTTLGALVVDAENYGDTVSYSVTVNGVALDDWKVFYKQSVGSEEYVYLIAGSPIPYLAIPELPYITKGEGEYFNGGYVSWPTKDPAPTSATTIQNASLWMANWYLQNYNTGTNARCISYLLNEDYWKAFKSSEYTDENGNSYVKGAIGTPTGEMFVASWNAKREATGDTEKYNIKIGLKSKVSYGYYVNDITSGTASSNTYGQKISQGDPLYAVGAFWLAAPGCINSDSYDNICGISGNYLYALTSRGSTLGLRPVVCMKSITPVVTGVGDTDIYLVK